MSRALPLGLLLLCAGLRAQSVPMATDLPSRPFFIKATWFIGGTGNWNYLTMDSQADRLYIAHGTAMQVVDTDTGSLMGTLDGFYEVQQIVLDDTGQIGFISDGGQGKVTVFDRTTLKKVAEIQVGANPRSMVYDPLTRLLFVMRTNPPAEAEKSDGIRGRSRAPTLAVPPDANGKVPSPVEAQADRSMISVIDTRTEQKIGEVQVAGQIGYAAGDANGTVFVSATGPERIFRLDAQQIAKEMSAANVDGGIAPAKTFRLGTNCAGAGALAYDTAHLRLFVACANRELLVVNADTGEMVASLPTGPGVNAVGYDGEHGLIFTANGGAEGSVTIIQQDVTDSYAVIQTLPTRQRASTLAVNPASGAVYLVTDYLGVDLNKPGGIGKLETVPVEGSFQVLTVAN